MGAAPPWVEKDSEASRKSVEVAEVLVCLVP